MGSLSNTDAEECDLLTGEWIPNPSGPFYTNESCPIIESHQNCMKNGRPDTGYLYWRWNPRSCSLPQFNAKRFLELMRNKSWSLIGDSISRNHVQSVLCMLSTVCFLGALSNEIFGFWLCPMLHSYRGLQIVISS